MRDLPQELEDEILDALKDDCKTLKNCSLTCRRWLPRSSMYLFASYTLQTTHPDYTARIGALQSVDRIRANVTTLTLNAQHSSDVTVIHDLPHLLDLDIDCASMSTSMLDVLLMMPRPPAMRNIDLLRIRNGYIGLVELVLRFCLKVATLSVEDLRDSPINDHHLALHVVRALRLRRVPSSILLHIAPMIAPTALEDLTIQPTYRLHADGTRSTHVNDFVCMVGSQARSYHHVDCVAGMRMAFTPIPPTLLSHATISSVALSVDEIGDISHSVRGQRLLVFLTSLPPRLTEFLLLYHTSSHGPDLVREMEEVEWPPIVRALQASGKSPNTQ